jgi:hypothetical protein
LRVEIGDYALPYPGRRLDGIGGEEGSDLMVVANLGPALGALFEVSFDELSFGFIYGVEGVDTQQLDDGGVRGTLH